MNPGFTYKESIDQSDQLQLPLNPENDRERKTRLQLIRKLLEKDRIGFDVSAGRVCLPQRKMLRHNYGMTTDLCGKRNVMKIFQSL